VTPSILLLERDQPGNVTKRSARGSALKLRAVLPPTLIFKMSEAIGTQLFQTRLSASERRAVLARLNIHGHCFMFCGRLILLNGVGQLLDAWQEFSKTVGDEATLLLVDDEPKLKQRVADSGLTNVQFIWLVQRAELPQIYQAAGVFVMLTLLDNWAKVVEEAVASGLLVINSIYNGGYEWISAGETGWLANPLNQAEMVDKLHVAWDARECKTELGEAARKTRAVMSVLAGVALLRQVVEVALKNSKFNYNRCASRRGGNGIHPSQFCE
jgi:glycosyltransferase involved in cell wall biosynthesis